MKDRDRLSVSTTDRAQHHGGGCAAHQEQVGGGEREEHQGALRPLPRTGEAQSLNSQHSTNDTILHGTSDDMLSMLISHCDNERLDEKNSRKIGF